MSGTGVSGTGDPVSAPALVDATARRRITTDGLDELLFVEAGAGTGKTKQLVDRVVALVLERGVPMREVAAITFTEAAASELRARVRESFERIVHDDTTGAPRRAAAEVALRDLDGAAIGTVHSFAQRILAEHPVEAGLPPHVEVLDEVESLLAFGRRWEAHVDRMFTDPALESVLATANRLGIRIDDPKLPSLRNIAVEFSDHWDRVGVAARRPLAVPAIRSEEPLAAFAEFAVVLERCRGIPEDRLAAKWLAAEPVLRAVVEALRAGDDRRVVRLLALCPRLHYTGLGRAAEWGGKDGKAAAQETARRLEAAFAEIRDELADAVLSALAGEVARFTLDAAGARRREGRLEFHDLLVLARELLRHHPESRAALHDRYTRLLVDEFQDTDPIQIELAVLIAAAVGDGAAERPWSEVAVERERLFFVGDPKQSIYRFRRADVGLFLAAREAFAPAPVRLSTNFRTVAPLVEWVNGVFAGLMVDDGSGRQPGYEPLTPYRPAGPGDHRVHLLGGPHAKDEGLDAAALRELEATTVADAVAGILAGPDAWPVATADGWRPARPEDIAILVPTRTSLGLLTDALRDRGVEFRAETGTLVYDTQEIRDLVAILRAIAHGSDAVALVAALRSPILGCGDDDLVTYAAAGGRWDLGPIRAELPAGHAVVEALDYLRELRAARWWTAPSVLLDRIVRERRVMTLAFAGPRARDVWRRVRFLVDQARLFEASQSADLVEFVAWCDLQRSDMARVHEPLLPESDDHAVRIMTMHGAKGLEFPITVLSGLTTRFGSRRRSVRVLWGDDGEVLVSTRKGVASEGFDRRAELEAEMDRDEKVRLLYVACTRARDHLLVAAHHVESTDSFAKLVWQHTQAAPERTWTPIESVSTPRTESPTRVPVRADPGTRAAQEGWTARREELLARGRRTRTVSATAVKRAGTDGAPEDTRADALTEERPVPAWRRGRGATAFGRAVHAVLQDVDLATGAAVDAMAETAARDEGIGAESGAVAAAVRSVLATPVVREAATAETFREMYVAAPVGERVVEGYIDLLVRTPDGLVVVDYKTDRVGPPDVGARAETYRLQLAAYAAAVERATGRPVARGVLVFAAADGSEGAVEHEFARAALGVEEVPAVLATVD